MELQASITEFRAKRDKRLGNTTAKWSLGGDPMDMTDPSQSRYDEDVADRNIVKDSLKRIRSFKTSNSPAPSAILINSGCKRYGEDVADRNLPQSPLKPTFFSTLETMSEDVTPPEAEFCVPVVEPIYISNNLSRTNSATQRQSVSTVTSHRKSLGQFELQRAALEAKLNRRPTPEYVAIKDVAVQDATPMVSLGKFPTSTVQAVFKDDHSSDTIGSSMLAQFPSDELLSAGRISTTLSMKPDHTKHGILSAILRRQRTDKVFRKNSGISSSQSSSSGWINEDSSGDSNISVKKSPRSVTRGIYSFIPPEYRRASVEQTPNPQIRRVENTDKSSNNNPSRNSASLAVEVDVDVESIHSQPRKAPPISETPRLRSSISSNDHFHYFNHTANRIPEAMRPAPPDESASGTHLTVASSDSPSLKPPVLEGGSAPISYRSSLTTSTQEETAENPLGSVENSPVPNAILGMQHI